MNDESNPGVLWFCFTSISNWSRKLALLSQPIRFKTKTNRTLVAFIFPRLRKFDFFPNSSFSAPRVVMVGCDNYIGFGFYDSHLKGALIVRRTKRDKMGLLQAISSSSRFFSTALQSSF